MQSIVSCLSDHCQILTLCSKDRPIIALCFPSMGSTAYCVHQIESFFPCLQSPQKSLGTVSPLSAVTTQAAPSHDSSDGGLVSKPKPKTIAAAAPKPSLFSDEEEDLFGSKSVEEQPKVEEKKEVIAESPKPRKPVGGVSMFGGVDLFAGKKPSFFEEKRKEEKVESAEKEEGEYKILVTTRDSIYPLSSSCHLNGLT